MVLRAVEAAVDFVQVDRTDPAVTVVTMREGMSTRVAFVAARMLLSPAEVVAARASFGGPPLAGDASDLEPLLPFISQSWVAPATASV